MNSVVEGYPDTRFPDVVDKNFHCPLCQLVLKEPVQCRRNEHYFCTPCITKYLEQTSATCPICTDALSVKTLKEPSRIVTNYMSALKIICDFAPRGCKELVELSGLARHVESCGFAPVKCSNEGCSKIISKVHRDHHEAEVCKHRKMKCPGCGKKVLYKKYDTHGCVLKRTVVDLKGQCEEMRNELAQLKEVKRKMEQRQSVQERTITEMKNMMIEMQDQMKRLSRKSPESLPRGQIIVAGGHDGSSYLDSAELYSFMTNTWVPLPAMRERRLAPSSFVYQNHVVVGGGFAGETSTDTMEGVNVSQEQKQWTDFPARLPMKCNRHTCVSYQKRLIIAGGENSDERKISDCIYEVSITPPNTSQLVGRMPQPRASHTAVLFKDKMLIVGGRTTNRYKDATKSVLLYDINKRKCKEIAPLPFAVSQMATVCHGDKMIVLGGQDREGNVLDEVIEYDVETGKSRTLPSMNQKRAACTAVVAGNMVVVMGGRDEKKSYLNSVECFSFDRQVWKDLTAMTVPRTYATSIVKTAV